jgi:hypothetical protein
VLRFLTVTCHFAVNSFILAAVEEYLVINYVGHISNLKVDTDGALEQLGFKTSEGNNCVNGDKYIA